MSSTALPCTVQSSKAGFHSAAADAQHTALHDTCIALNIGAHDTALTLTLHRNAPQSLQFSVGLCVPRVGGHCTPQACLARVRGWRGCGGGGACLLARGGGEGLGVTAQQFKDDWCQLLVGLSRGEADRQKQIYKGWGWGGGAGGGGGGGEVRGHFEKLSRDFPPCGYVVNGDRCCKVQCPKAVQCSDPLRFHCGSFDAV